MGNSFSQPGPKQNKSLEFIRKLWLAVGLIWESDRRYAMANVVLIVLQAAIPLLLLYIVKTAIDTIVEAGGEPSVALAESSFAKIAALFALGAGIAIILSVIGAASRYVRIGQALKVTDHVRLLLQAKALDADLAFFESPQHWDSFYRTRQQASHRPRSMVEGLLNIGRDGASLLVMLGVLISFHWLVIPVLIMSGIPGTIRRLHNASNYYDWERDATQEERYANYVDRLLASDRTARELRGFNFGGLLRERFVKIRRRFRRNRLKHARRRSITEFLGEILIILAVFGLLAYMGYSALSGAITMGDFVIYFAALQRAWGHVGQILRSFTKIYEDTLFVSDFHDIMDLEPAIVDPPSPKPIPPKSDLGICLDNVSFGYRPAEQMIVKDVNIHIKPGESVAFVGPNGSGKTTLIKLICRLYDPTDGKITLGKTDLREFTISELRKQFSYVFQDFVQYQMSAQENIWLGDHLHAADAERIAAAAEKSGADQVVTQLREGYQSILGHEFSGGHELSGGQWQRFALARFFVRDAPILLLDEPMSAVDAVAESQILESLRSHAKGRTVVIVSHRLSAVRQVDRIFVMDKGRIVECGPHEELIRNSGLYARMFEAQAREYRRGGET